MADTATYTWETVYGSYDLLYSDLYPDYQAGYSASVAQWGSQGAYSVLGVTATDDTGAALENSFLVLMDAASGTLVGTPRSLDALYPDDGLQKSLNLVRFEDDKLIVETVAQDSAGERLADAYLSVLATDTGDLLTTQPIAADYDWMEMRLHGSDLYLKQEGGSTVWEPRYQLLDTEAGTLTELSQENGLRAYHAHDETSINGQQLRFDTATLDQLLDSGEVAHVVSSSWQYDQGNAHIILQLQVFNTLTGSEQLLCLAYNADVTSADQYVSLLTAPQGAVSVHGASFNNEYLHYLEPVPGQADQFHLQEVQLQDGVLVAQTLLGGQALSLSDLYPSDQPDLVVEIDRVQSEDGMLLLVAAATDSNGTAQAENYLNVYDLASGDRLAMQAMAADKYVQAARLHGTDLYLQQYGNWPDESGGSVWETRYQLLDTETDTLTVLTRENGQRAFYGGSDEISVNGHQLRFDTATLDQLLDRGDLVNGINASWPNDGHAIVQLQVFNTLSGNEQHLYLAYNSGATSADQYVSVLTVPQGAVRVDNEYLLYLEPVPGQVEQLQLKEVQLQDGVLVAQPLLGGQALSLSDLYPSDQPDLAVEIDRVHREDGKLLLVAEAKDSDGTAQAENYLNVYDLASGELLTTQPIAANYSWMQMRLHGTDLYLQQSGNWPDGNGGSVWEYRYQLLDTEAGTLTVLTQENGQRAFYGGIYETSINGHQLRFDTATLDQLLDSGDLVNGLTTSWLNDGQGNAHTIVQLQVFNTLTGSEQLLYLAYDNNAQVLNAADYSAHLALDAGDDRIFFKYAQPPLLALADADAPGHYQLQQVVLEASGFVQQPLLNGLSIELAALQPGLETSDQQDLRDIDSSGSYITIVSGRLNAYGGHMAESYISVLDGQTGELVASHALAKFPWEIRVTLFNSEALLETWGASSDYYRLDLTDPASSSLTEIDQQTFYELRDSRSFWLDGEQYRLDELQALQPLQDSAIKVEGYSSRDFEQGGQTYRLLQLDLFLRDSLTDQTLLLLYGPDASGINDTIAAEWLPAGQFIGGLGSGHFNYAEPVADSAGSYYIKSGSYDAQGIQLDAGEFFNGQPLDLNALYGEESLPEGYVVELDAIRGGPVNTLLELAAWNPATGEDIDDTVLVVMDSGSGAEQGRIALDIDPERLNVDMNAHGQVAIAHQYNYYGAELFYTLVEDGAGAYQLAPIARARYQAIRDGAEVKAAAVTYDELEWGLQRLVRDFDYHKHFDLSDQQYADVDDIEVRRGYLVAQVEVREFNGGSTSEEHVVVFDHLGRLVADHTLVDGDHYLYSMLPSDEADFLISKADGTIQRIGADGTVNTLFNGKPIVLDGLYPDLPQGASAQMNALLSNDEQHVLVVGAEGQDGSEWSREYFYRLDAEGTPQQGVEVDLNYVEQAVLDQTGTLYLLSYGDDDNDGHWTAQTHRIDFSAAEPVLERVAGERFWEVREEQLGLDNLLVLNGKLIDLATLSLPGIELAAGETIELDGGFHAQADGSLIAELFIFNEVAPAADEDRTVLARLGPDGQVLETSELPPRYWSIELDAQGGGNAVYLQSPLDENGDFKVQRLALEGETLPSIDEAHTLYRLNMAELYPELSQGAIASVEFATGSDQAVVLYTWARDPATHQESDTYTVTVISRESGELLYNGSFIGQHRSTTILENLEGSDYYYFYNHSPEGAATFYRMNLSEGTGQLETISGEHFYASRSGREDSGHFEGPLSGNGAQYRLSATEQADGSVRVAISLDADVAIQFADIKLSYDEAHFDLSEVALQPGWSSSVTDRHDGENPAGGADIAISAVSLSPADTTQPFMTLTFGKLADVTAFDIAALEISLGNAEESLVAQPSGAGSASIELAHSSSYLEGVISFWRDADSRLEGVEISLQQGNPSAGYTELANALTDAQGHYRFDGLYQDAYRLEASMDAPAAELYREAVTATDASNVARMAVGLIGEVNGYQQAAADVDGDGRITAADASMIARQAVGLVELGGWVLLPETESAATDVQLAPAATVAVSGATSQNWAAVLLGDVDGSAISLLDDLVV